METLGATAFSSKLTFTTKVGCFVQGHRRYYRDHIITVDESIAVVVIKIEDKLDLFLKRRAKEKHHAIEELSMV